MGVTETQQILIDAHLKMELQGEALQNFERELETNPILKEEFIFQQNLANATKLNAVKEAIAQARINNLLENKDQYPQLESVQHNIKEARAVNSIQERKQKWRKYLSIGAMAASLLIVVLCGWRTSLDRGLKNQVALEVEMEVTKMFKKINFNVPTSVIELSGARLEFINFELKEMEKAHEERRFEEVFIILDKLRERDYRPQQLLYYEAGLLAQTGNYEKSTAVLSALIEENTDIEYDARWFSGLVYLKMDEKAKAKKEFEALLNQPNEYQDKARHKLKEHCLL